MSDFELEPKAGQLVQVWRSNDGIIQLAVDDGLEGTALGLTADQAYQVAAALMRFADEAKGGAG